MRPFGFSGVLVAVPAWVLWFGLLWAPGTLAWTDVPTRDPSLRTPLPPLRGDVVDRRNAPPPTLPDTLADLRRAVDVMQGEYFEIGAGTWPTAIDWTAAVMNTEIIGALTSLSTASHPPSGPESAAGPRAWDVENEINRYFAHTAAYYFGEDILALRNEANDDMLWVVLGWLEAIKFARTHSGSHFPQSSGDPTREWHGMQFVTAFAHRARVFYDIAAQGWDTKLCGGGMIWNPHLGPYKNAITNELYIAASIGMYLYHPGDNDSSPFTGGRRAHGVAGHAPTKPLDPLYLRSAIDAYDWLKDSNMTNSHGLFVDGFHITGWRSNDSIGTGKCDERNEMVYTYNQGVLLSGLRGLWEGTGGAAYLEDGHTLVRAAIRATGWQQQLLQEGGDDHAWAGLGRAGVLEDDCDARGQCSQDSQTFKGIFFHHLTLFCEPLPLAPRHPGVTFAADAALASLHRQSCREYVDWVAHNVRAALATRDDRGRFGMWWGASDDDPGRSSSDGATGREGPGQELPDGAIDYRNSVGEPMTSTEESTTTPLLPLRGGRPASEPDRQHVLGTFPMCSEDEVSCPHPIDFSPRPDRRGPSSSPGDANDRGRGRTVETQGGGVTVLRALWELLNLE